MNVISDDLVQQLEERIGRTGQTIRALRERIDAAEAERSRLQHEQETLLERIAELESEVDRLRHLEHENAEILDRQRRLTEEVHRFLALLKGEE